MSLVLGRSRQRKDNFAGIKAIWIFPYVRYTRSQISLSGEYLSVFPTNTIYKYSVENGGSINEIFSINENGDYLDQSLEFKFAKVNSEINSQTNKISKRLVRAICLDNNGNYNLFGLYNGLEFSGGNSRGLSKGDFSGITISLKGKERVTAPFMFDLSLFSEYSNSIVFFSDVFESGVFE